MSDPTCPDAVEPGRNGWFSEVLKPLQDSGTNARVSDRNPPSTYYAE